MASESGSATSTRGLLLEVAPAVRRLCRGVLGTDHPELDDAVQESLSALVQALPDYRNECPLKFYALRIAFNRSVKLKRRSQRQRQLFVGMNESLEVQDDASSPLQQVTAMEARATLEEALSEIPEEQMDALVLRIVLGFSLAEIAAISQTPLNTVKTRLRLGKDALRRQLKGDAALRAKLEHHQVGRAS